MFTADLRMHFENKNKTRFLLMLRASYEHIYTTSRMLRTTIYHQLSNTHEKKLANLAV